MCVNCKESGVMLIKLTGFERNSQVTSAVVERVYFFSN